MMKRTQSEGTIPEGASTAEVLSWIDRRIGLLNNIRAAVLVAAGEPQRRATMTRKPAVRLIPERKAAQEPPPQKAKGSRILIQKILSAGPLTTDELFNRLQKRGWQTTSTNPKSLLGVTLRAMRDVGKLRRVGTDWELAVLTGHKGSIVETDSEQTDVEENIAAALE